MAKQNAKWTRDLQKAINANFGLSLKITGTNDAATRAAIQEIRRIGGFSDGVMADGPVEKFIRSYKTAPTGGGRGAPKPAPPQRPALSLAHPVSTPKPLSGPAAAVEASKKRQSEAELASLQDQDRRVSQFENRLDRQIRGQQPEEPAYAPTMPTGGPTGVGSLPPRPPLTTAAAPPPGGPDFAEAAPYQPRSAAGGQEAIDLHNADVELNRAMPRPAPTGVARGAPVPAPPVSLASVLPKPPRPPLVIRPQTPTIPPGGGVGLPGGKEYPDVPSALGGYAQDIAGIPQQLMDGLKQMIAGGGPPAPDTAPASPEAPPPLSPAGGPPNPRRDPIPDMSNAGPQEGGSAIFDALRQRFGNEGQPATAADAVNMEAGRPPLGAPAQTMDYAPVEQSEAAAPERTLGQTSTFHTGSGKTRLDPRLLDTLQRAARAFPLRVEAFSGVAARGDGTRNHPAGKAIDVQIYDQQGNLLPSSPARAKAMGVPFAPAFRVYEQFAQTARDIQTKLHPDMPFRWGGYFRQGTEFDLMHFDITSNNTAYGNWEEGLTPAGLKRIAAISGGEQPISVGMNDATMQHIAAFGYTGADAVTDFQRDSGAKAIDGIIGPETSALVTARLNGVPPDAVTASLSVPVTAPPTMPTPKADIPNPDAIDQMNPPVASATVPPGIGQGFLQAVIDAPSARWGTGGMKIAMAARDLSQQDPAAVDAYFGHVKASNPEVIRAAGAVYQQQPEHFKVLETYATPDQLKPLVAGMTPDPNASPRRPALSGSVNGVPVPKASTSTDGMMVPPRPNLRPRIGITPDQITGSKSFQTAQRDAAMPMPRLRPSSTMNPPMPNLRPQEGGFQTVANPPRPALKPGESRPTPDQIRTAYQQSQQRLGPPQPPRSVATTTVPGEPDSFDTWFQSHNGTAAAAEPVRPQRSGFEGSPEMASNKRPSLSFTSPTRTVGSPPGAGATPERYGAMNPPMPNLRPVRPADTGGGGFGQGMEDKLTGLLHTLTGTKPTAEAQPQTSGGGGGGFASLLANLFKSQGGGGGGGGGMPTVGGGYQYNPRTGGYGYY